MASGTPPTELKSLLKVVQNLVSGHMNSLPKEEKLFININMAFTFMRRLFVDRIIINDHILEALQTQKIREMQELEHYSTVVCSEGLLSTLRRLHDERK